MPRRIYAPILILILMLTATGLVSCKAGTSTRAKKAEPARKLTPTELLSPKMFILKDGRDMRLAVVRLMNTGVDEDQLVGIARNLKFSDFMEYLSQHSAAKQVLYVGNSRFRVDALRYILGAEQFGEAHFYFRVKKFKTEGNQVDAAILEQVVLDKNDVTIFATNRIYPTMLEMKLGLGTDQ